MQELRIMSVVGARPNFMKIAPFVRAVNAHNQAGAGRPLRHYLVHTGQHYDASMSETFFTTLGIPRPDVDLEVGSGTHAEQVGRTMIAFEKALHAWRPDWVVVVGDVNATCACAITAKKEHLRVAHIEAGLRSFDRTMPEEINRIVTDRLSDLLFTTDAIADDNLRAEGVPDAQVRRVGNIMIDTLEVCRERAAALDFSAVVRDGAMFPSAGEIPEDGEYAVVTMHRPSNVDRRETLEPLVRYLTTELAAQMPVLWSLHPRTRKQLEAFGLWDRVTEASDLTLLGPVGYLEMLRLNLGARIMLTDSGGLQEECCVTGTPCVTLRFNTERPVTLLEHGGTGILAGNSVDKIREGVAALVNRPRQANRPELWDGHTADRIVKVFGSWTD